MADSWPRKPHPPSSARRLLLAAEGALRRASRRARRLEPWTQPIDRLDVRAPRRLESGGILLLAALPWGFRFQRPQQLARALVEEGVPVLYADLFERRFLAPSLRTRRLARGLTIAVLRPPLSSDLYRRPLGEEAERALARQLLRLEPVPLRAVVCQWPTLASVAEEVATSLGAHWLYDRIDLAAAFDDVPAEMAQIEAEALLRADLVTASAESLLPTPASGRWPPLLLRNGVRLEDFASSPGDSLDGDCVGYVGAIASWFDVEAVATAARSLPEMRFRLAGRLENAAAGELARLPNVDLLGEVPYHQVPGLVRSFSVSLLPFLDTELTRSVDPVKLYESLASGRPLVARRLPELERWSPPAVYTYRSGEELASCIERALSENDGAAIAHRRSLVKGETWRQRARLLLSTLEAR